jgi:alpha-tubulin suppressor-like RCC1 family protein
MHSVALSSDGSLFTWGDGSHGQLGHSQLHAMAGGGAQNIVTLLLPQKISRIDPSALSPENRWEINVKGS